MPSEKRRPRGHRDEPSDSTSQGLERTRAAVRAFGNEINTTLGQGLEQSLRTANQALGEWAKNFRGGMSVSQQALTVFQSVSQEALAGYSRAIGTSIADSLVYGTSIQAAMEKALKAVTANLAGQAATQAIYSTALGFLRLAEWDFAAATSAFEAAGVFASVTGLAGAVGANIPGPKISSQTLGDAAPHAPQPSPFSFDSSSSTSRQSPSSRVQVIVMGETQAAAWLTKVINHGVKYQDLELTATRSKRPTYSTGS